MVTEWVITLPTEPTEGEIVKSHPLFSFINIGQRGRKYNKCNFICYVIVHCVNNTDCHQ